MDLVTAFMNAVAPPVTLLTLTLLLPSLYFLKISLAFLSSFFPEDMATKVVVITGASSGIGEQMAYQYARRGACLALVARREDRLREIADAAMVLGSPDAIVVPADVSKPDDCRRFVDVTTTHFGRLDHLVNNAGVMSVCLFEQASDVTKFEPVMDINFWGSIYPTFFAIPHLKKSRGRVVVTTSIAGDVPTPRTSFYNASKAALKNFYETLRIEFGSDIGVTIATPGVTESEITQGKFFSKDGTIKFDEEMRDVVVGMAPVGYAEDCARAVVDAACRGKRYVTVPSWYRMLSLVWFVAPEVVEWGCRLMYFTGAGRDERKALSKRLLDATGAKRLLYPPSIQSQVQPRAKKLKKAE